MSDASSIGAFLACLFLCPAEDLPLQFNEPIPSLAGTRYDCAARPRKASATGVWYGQITGRNDMDDFNRTIRVEGCFPTRSECELVLDRVEGLTAGLVWRSCTPGLPR